VTGATAPSTAPAPSPHRSDEIAVLAPTGSDGPVAQRVLGKWDLHVVAYPTMDALSAAIERGVGAVLLAEEALRTGALERLVAALGTQASWSDVPIVVLTAEDELSGVIARGVEALAKRGNVTLLERPVRVATLVTVVRTALRARIRQYDLREHLTELQAARDAADEARGAAERANRAKSEFLAIMSHELRTPLNAIGGYAELMELGIRGNVTPEQRMDLDRIQRSQRHLLGLINGVLNYARVDAGVVNYDLTNVAVEEVLAACEALIAPQTRAKGLGLLHEPCDPAITARADREKVQQIVLNLLSNAVKFTDPGGRIVFGCAQHERGVVIRVSDTGRGIAADNLERVFQPFVQVDSTLTRTHEGTGLGLAISRDLARGMGGDLTVESSVGVGSTFTLTLPG